MCPGFQGAESALCRDAGKPPSRALHPAPTTQGTSPEGGVLAGVTAVMISEAGGSGTAAPSPQGLLHCSVLQSLYTRRAMHPTADAQCLLSAARVWAGISQNGCFPGPPPGQRSGQR